MLELGLSLPVAIGILIILLLLSAFFSGSETALTRARRTRLRILSDEGDKGAKRAEHLLHTPEKMLSAILLGNNFVNFAASSLTAAIFIVAFGDAGIIYATIAMTVIVVVFAEVLPKTIAVVYAEPIACLVSRPLKWLMYALNPIIISLLGAINIIKRILRIPQHQQRGFSQQEIAVMVDISAESGMLDDAREQMLASSLSLHEIPIKQLMTPRNKMVMLDANQSVAECKADALLHPHSRYPVFLSQTDNILGIIHLRTIMSLEDDAQALAHAMIWSTPLYAPSSRDALNQLFEFQGKQQHMTFVVDEFGDIEGLLTLEDIIEEIVGDIIDESDVPISPEILLQPDGSHIVSSTANVHDINQKLDSDLPENSATTIGGLIIETLGDQPENNLCIQIEDLNIEILTVMGNTKECLQCIRLRKTTEPESKY